MIRRAAAATGRYAANRPRSAVRLRRPAIAVLAVVALAVTGGVAYAMWMANAQTAAASIASGDLSVTVGTPTWQQVTPGVASPASGTLTSTPTDFVSMPGDVIEIKVPVTTYLKGDNLLAGFLSVYADGSEVNPDLSITYRVADQAGNNVAPAQGEVALGEQVAVPGLIGDDDGTTANWTVILRVVVGGDMDWSQSDVMDEPLARWTSGTFDVDLVQVRSADSAPTAGGAR